MSPGQDKKHTRDLSPNEITKYGIACDTMEKLQLAEATSFLQPTFAPKMMSLAKFLEPFDKSALTDEDAAQKYSVYVAGFLNEQLADHFERHKDSAWFRDKYHPDNMPNKDKLAQSIRSRFDVFNEMRQSGFFHDISLDYSNRASVEKVLDQFAIKLAGGGADDLAELDAFDPKSLEPKNIPARIKRKEKVPKARKDPQDGSHTVEHLSTKVSEKPETSKEPEPSCEGVDEPEQPSTKNRDGKGCIDGNSSDSSGGGSSSSTSSASSSSSSSASSGSHSSATSSGSSSTASGSRSRSSVSRSHSSRASSVAGRSKKRSSKKHKKTPSEAPKTVMEVEKTVKEGVEAEAFEVNVEEMVEASPPPMHVTRVVYLPYVPLTVHRATLETLLGEHPDFLRLAILEPTPILAPSAATDYPLPPSLGQRTAPGALILHRPAWVTFRSIRSASSEAPAVFCHRLAERLRAEGNATKEASDLAIALSAAKLLPMPLPRDRVKASTRLATCCQAADAQASLNAVCTRGVARRHLVMAAKLVGRLDEVSGLWKQASCEDRDCADWTIPRPIDLDPEHNLIGASSALANLSVRTSNPLLENLTDHLVDECSPEEEEAGLLYGDSTSGTAVSSTKPKDATADIWIPADADLLRALDDLLFYLRLVYSVDFYSPALYASEADMPHPCVVIHVRPSMPHSTSSLRLPSPPRLVFSKKQRSLQSAHRVFARQICRIFRLVTSLRVGTLTTIREGDPPVSGGGSSSDPPKLSKEAADEKDDDGGGAGDGLAEQAPGREMDDIERRLRMLGFRDVNEVVEAFIKANTKRKRRKVDIIWVCPLSEKKFRGPAFVRKHILNKHAEKLEEIKKENAYFFNNFLLDQMRPELMKPPRRRLPALDASNGGGGGVVGFDSGNRKTRAGGNARGGCVSDGSEADDDPQGRWRHPRAGGGFFTSPQFSTPAPRYWHNRGRGGWGGFHGNWDGGGGPRRGLGYQHPWGAGQDYRRGSGGAGAYNRSDGSRNNYVDLDAPR